MVLHQTEIKPSSDTALVILFNIPLTVWRGVWKMNLTRCVSYSFPDGARIRNNINFDEIIMMLFFGFGLDFLALLVLRFEVIGIYFQPTVLQYIFFFTEQPTCSSVVRSCISILCCSCYSMHIYRLYRPERTRAHPKSVQTNHCCHTKHLIHSAVLVT